MKEYLKETLITTPLVSAALSFRDIVNILSTAYFHPENVCRVANDQIAMRLITSMCQSNKIFVDVGAHIGSVMSMVARRDSSIKIVAVEAMPDKVAKLRRKFPFAEIHDCAVGETTGDISFFINLTQSGYSSLKNSSNAKKGSVSEIKVPIRRLDQLVVSKDVDIIKIDVVGSELEVLRGSSKLLNNSRPIVVFENGIQQDDGLAHTKEALYQFLASNDYDVLIPNRLAHSDPGLTLDGFIESHLYPMRTTNYFAIPHERRTEARDRARNIINKLS